MKTTCTLCSNLAPGLASDGGFVCSDCWEQHHQGRDNATRQAKQRKRALTAQAQVAQLQHAGQSVPDDLAYRSASAALMARDDVCKPPVIVCGETLGPCLADTLAGGSTVALDASRERLELLDTLGADCVALALDASQSIGAANSLEKALAHQLGALHQTAMRYLGKSALQSNPDTAVRMANLSLRAMGTFQSGLLTLKRLRSTGEQRITIQHVSVNDGGQAVIGQVQRSVGAGRK